MNDHFWSATFTRSDMPGVEMQSCRSCGAVRVQRPDGTWRIKGPESEECRRHPHVWDPFGPDDDDEPIYD